MVLSAVVFVWSIMGQQLAKIVYDFRLVSNSLFMYNKISIIYNLTNL